MRIFFLVCFSILISYVTFGQSFNQNFQNKSLRCDFILFGNSNQTNAIFSQLEKEAYWGGTTSRLIFPDKGNYRIQLFDIEKNKLLFSKGFNSLFEEWQHTEEAKNNSKAFYHAQQVPFPKKTVKWILEKRQFDGSFSTLLTKIINPNDATILDEKPNPYPIKKIIYNGNPNQKLDLAIIAEGYTENEQTKFYKDAQKMVEYLFQTEPFNLLKNKFNVYAIAASSLESGTDEPLKKSYKNTVVNSTFNTFNVPRYLASQDQKSIADIASSVPYDQIFVLVNTDAYGGGAFYNHLNLTSANHLLSGLIFVHEFGHGLVGLADEYYDSSTSFNNLYNLNMEPWEPNITTLVNFKSKWKDLVATETPIPTPRNKQYLNTIGVFEGGGYVAKGIFCPSQNCIMKTLEIHDFCPVCKKAIIETINFLSE